jgi:hypothetical protein
MRYIDTLIVLSFLLNTIYYTVIIIGVQIDLGVELFIEIGVDGTVG